MATTNGISLAPDSLVEEVAHLMAQELPYTGFDTDTDVASMLNAKLDFDEALLAENVALACGTQDGREASEDVAREGENRDSDPEGEDSGRYFRFARTVVCDTSSGPDAASQTHTAPSIPQLDGAGGGSDSDEGDTSEDEAMSPTRQLSVSLKRLESIYSLSEQEVPPADILEPSLGPDDELIQEEVVQASSGASTFQGGGSGREASDTDDSTSSSDSVEPFRDDLNDPDYSPEKAEHSPLKMGKFKRLTAKPALLSGHGRPNMPLHSKPVPAASVRVIQNPLTSPVLLNGANSFAVQPGVARGKTVVVRLNSSRPAQAGQQQQQGSAPQMPSNPKVLLVNGQGQILLKDPKTNTYQSVSTSSPAYSKISQIAKLLHGGNVVQRSLSHLVIKPPGAVQTASQLPPGASPATTNPPPAALTHTPGERKVVVRVVPVRSSASAAALAPPTPTQHPPVAPPLSPPPPAPICTRLEASTTQAIINRAMSGQCDEPRPQPIILAHRRQEKRKRAHRLQVAARPGSQALWWKGRLVNEGHGNVQQRTATSTQSQVRVKRVSSLAERPLSKKSKMDLLTNVSNGPDDVIEPRYVNVFCPEFYFF